MRSDNRAPSDQVATTPRLGSGTASSAQQAIAAARRTTATATRMTMVALAACVTIGLMGGVAARPAGAVTISWVTVGDPGNADDDTGYGAVANEFRIMEFEWTNSQYVEFLNTVDPNAANPNGIYKADMGSNARGGISFVGSNSPGSKYVLRSNMGNKPVNFVSVYDAMRVANWLHNGQGPGSTETGAYTMSNATGGNFPAVNQGALYFLPTEDQWYKAAYYDPNANGGTGGYYNYGTGSDTQPTPVTANGAGDGSAADTGNFANWNSGADWNGQDGNVTTIGTNGGPSPYGAFDMAGNVWEINDLTGDAGSLRGLRGGGWLNDDPINTDRRGITTDFYDSYAGFRIAAVPEPSTWAMGLAGLACGGWGLLRRRRAPSP